MRPRLLTYSLLVLLLTSCLPDDSDDCCYQVLLRYHETVYGEDRFWSDIHQTRHLLYDDRGRLVGEYSVDANNRQQVLVLDVEDGRYTMVTVANATDRTIFENMEDLSRLTIRQAAPVTRQADDVEYGNGDELYFNRQSFEAGREPVEIDCELSNIHCHLHVQVQWKNHLPAGREYTLRASAVPSAYLLSETHAIDGLAFPQTADTLVTHSLTEYPVNFEMEFELITLRYTNEWVPVLQLYSDGEPVTGLINLDRAFTYYGWYPDQTTIQDYWIRLYVNANGSVDLERWLPGRVSDWVDGGSITN